jgi:peptidoglycan/LPS O-acetylase OafA/YrhL
VSRLVGSEMCIRDRFKSYFNLRTLWSDTLSSRFGQFGVIIFFVLSGFLITYLLLLEKENTGINVKNFYIRRILRIWPLYFIILILGFFVFPHINFFDVPNYQHVGNNFVEKLLLFIFFLANVAFVFFPGVAYANVLWSVAVEEQFYLIWPNIIKYCRSILKALFIALFIYMFIKACFFLNIFGFDDFWSTSIYKLINRTRFSAMIIGGFGAFLLYNSWKKVLQFIYFPIIQVISILGLIVLVFFRSNTPLYKFFENEVFSVLVAILIVNIASNANSILKLENRYLDFLGKISFGFYVYHSVIAVICIKVFIKFYPETTFLYLIWSFCLILLVSLLTILVSHLSYKFIEEKLLKRKYMFSNIESGDMVKKTE